MTAKLSFLAGKKILFLPFEIDVDSIVTIKSLTIQLKLTSDSKSFFSLTDFDLDLDSLKISLYGWWKFLVGYLIEDMIDDGSLQKSLQCNIEKTFRTMINQILAEKSFPFYEPVNESPIRADFSLLESPLVTPDDISLVINGTFYTAGQTSYLPFINDTMLPIHDLNSQQAI
jgi:hypothetical protein